MRGISWTINPNIRDKKYIVNHNKPPRKNSTKLFVIFRKKEIKNYEFYASLSILVMYNTFFKNVDYYQLAKYLQQFIEDYI